MGKKGNGAVKTDPKHDDEDQGNPFDGVTIEVSDPMAVYTQETIPGKDALDKVLDDEVLSSLTNDD